VPSESSVDEDRFFYLRDLKLSFSDFLKRLHRNIVALISAADVHIELDFKSIGQRTNHDADWLVADPGEFLNQVLAQATEDENRSMRSGHANQVRVVRDETGRIFGRAALKMYSSVREFREPRR
jgi:hypothetical protein